jgi:hypothetical protein
VAEAIVVVWGCAARPVDHRYVDFWSFWLLFFFWQIQLLLSSLTVSSSGKVLHLVHSRYHSRALGAGRCLGSWSRLLCFWWFSGAITSIFDRCRLRLQCFDQFFLRQPPSPSEWWNSGAGCCLGSPGSVLTCFFDWFGHDWRDIIHFYLALMVEIKNVLFTSQRRQLIPPRNLISKEIIRDPELFIILQYLNYLARITQPYFFCPWTWLKDHNPGGLPKLDMSIRNKLECVSVWTKLDNFCQSELVRHSHLE